MSDKTIGIAMLGCGIVGSGVARILRENGDLIRKRTGMSFELRHVVVRDVKKPRDVNGAQIHSDGFKAINDPNVQVVIELIGGTTQAGDYIEAALKLGKPVVTANKSLLALRGPELFGLAHEKQTCIAFEASCGGGIPIIESILRSLVANRIDAVLGIVNGTCNFILTKMSKNGWSYAQALKEAQAAGFAEADPTLDVSGRDAAQKLAVLASLAFNVRVREADIHVEGIDKLDATDIELAGKFGYAIKLLVIAERKADEKIALRVHPTLVHEDDMLADVSGSFNAVSVYGSALGHALFYGRGAGQMPTASAVVADLVNVGLGTTQIAFRQLSATSRNPKPASVLPISELQSRYYLRMTVRDEPGVFAKITKILGDEKISLAAVNQQEANLGQMVSIVILTHLAKEGGLRGALQKIDALDCTQGNSVCLRIIDQPKEFGG